MLKALAIATLVSFSTYTYAGFVCTGNLDNSKITIVIEEFKEYGYIAFASKEGGSTIAINIRAIDASEYISNERIVKIYVPDERYRLDLQYDYKTNIGSLLVSSSVMDLRLETDQIECKYYRPAN